VSDLLAALPMAIVMVAGPQIISAIFLATSDQARRNSVTFLLGVALATTNRNDDRVPNGG
jgi:small neutral amino acid transporter SnatA (MarC family)